MTNSPHRHHSSSRAGGNNSQHADEAWDVVEYNSATDTYRTAPESIEPISLAVISAIAAETGIDPTVAKPLYTAIDPDALDTLVANANGTDLRITFEYIGYEVVVDGAGHISVVERDD